MTTDLASILASLPPDQREVVSRATYQDFHPSLIEATKTGDWTILDFWDVIPWLQGPGDWSPWRAFIAATFGLPLSPSELATFRKCTGRQNPPTEQVDEAWMPVGRRARKSATAAVVAAFVGAYWDHKSYTAPGQRAVIPVLAKNKADAQTIKQFIDAIFNTPQLAFLIEKSDTEVVRLITGCDIQIKAATIMAGRSPAIPLAILDEVAFFRTDDAANPDTEILRGIRPAMATVKHPLLLGLSSPYAKRGELWNNYRQHFGKEGSRVLVWQADTLTMHPGNPEVAAHVAKETAKDPVSAAAEYGAKFRDDVEQFVSEELVERVTVSGRLELPYEPGIQYAAFCDPSGGTSDGMTLAIAHWVPATEGRADRVVLDVVLEEPSPFEPSEVVAEFVKALKAYGVKDVEGDHYAGEWPREPFRKAGIAYHPSEYVKRDIYKNTLPLMTSLRCELVDSARLKAQLVGLDRRTAPSGQDVIEHQQGQHDDVANAACGALFRASRLRRIPKASAPPPPRSTHEILSNTIREAREADRKRPTPSVRPYMRRKR